MACKYVKRFFKKMPPSDYFGFISLGRSSNNEEILLEEKERNPYTKKLFLKAMADGESESLFLGDAKAKQVRRQRLDKALQKALDWQTDRVEDTPYTINEHTYYSPHKWIICLIGSDIYPVSSFLMHHRHKLQQAANLSISIMGLSDEPLHHEHVKDYRRLCISTREGMYLNIVDKDAQKVDDLVEKFFGSMQVYPVEKFPILREFFQGI